MHSVIWGACAEAEPPLPFEGVLRVPQPDDQLDELERVFEEGDRQEPLVSIRDLDDDKVRRRAAVPREERLLGTHLAGELTCLERNDKTSSFASKMTKLVSGSDSMGSAEPDSQKRTAPLASCPFSFEKRPSFEVPRARDAILPRFASRLTLVLCLGPAVSRRKRPVEPVRVCLSSALC